MLAFTGRYFFDFSPPDSIAANRQRQTIKIRQTLTDLKNKFKMKSASD